MIKKIAAVLLALLLFVVLLCSCGRQMEQNGDEKRAATSFSVVDSYDHFKIIVDMDTGVMYAQSNSPYNCGTLTLLVNYDGSPRTFPGFDAKEDRP